MRLDAQAYTEYTKVVADLGGVCAYGPKGCTEGWQPIDSGHIGATFKALANSKFEAWMEKDYVRAGLGKLGEVGGEQNALGDQAHRGAPHAGLCPGR